MNEEKVFELSANKTSDEINDMYHVLNESIRMALSRLLMDTSEENRKEVEIPLEHRACGLSTLEMITIVSIWQDEKEGIISVQCRGDDYDMDIDELEIEDRIQILRELELNG